MIVKNGILQSNDLLSISKGEVFGHFTQRKFARVEDIDGTNPFLDIWDYNKFGGTIHQYVYSTTADIDTISSSNAGDTQQVYIYGLQSDYQLKFQTATLNGQNKVTLTTPLIRIYRVQNAGSTDFAGQIYVYPDTAITGGVPNDTTKVRAFVNAATNQTYMIQYTVPAGKTAYVYSAGFSSIKSSVTSMQIDIFIRPFGGVFLSQGTLAQNSQGTGAFTSFFIPPVAIPQRTDITAKCDSSANNSGISMDLGFVLVNNDPTDRKLDVDGVL